LLGWLAIHKVPEKPPLYLLAASMGKERYEPSIIGRLFPSAAEPPPVKPKTTRPPVKPRLAEPLPRQVQPEPPELIGQADVKGDRAVVRWRVGPAGVPLDEMFLEIVETTSNSYKQVPVKLVKGTEFSSELAFPGPGNYEVAAAVRWHGILIESEDTWRVSIAGQRSKPKMYVYGIGCAKYQNRGFFNLPNAGKEVSDIAQALRTHAADLYDTFPTVWEPNPEKRETWEDAAPSKSEVVDRLRTLGKKLSDSDNPNDVGVLLLSGHGMDESGKYFFVPSDGKQGVESSYISFDDMVKYIVPPPQEKAMPHLVVVLDTCFSAKFVNSFEEALRNETRNGRIAIICAAVKAAPDESTLAKRLIQSLAGRGSTHGVFVSRDDIFYDANAIGEVRTYRPDNSDFNVAKLK
jgi:hypothetical protein